MGTVVRMELYSWAQQGTVPPLSLAQLPFSKVLNITWCFSNSLSCSLTHIKGLEGIAPVSHILSLPVSDHPV